MKISPFCKLIAGMIFFLALTGWNMAAAREKPGSDTDLPADKPLHITADKMIAHQKDNMVEFIGNVKAVQEDAVLLAQVVKIYLNPSDEKEGDAQNPAQSRVKKIVASENVEYTAGERKAFADKAVYTSEDDILILTGKSARLLTGTSWVSGTKITLFRKEDRAMVESDGQTRVQALFNPEDKPADQ